MSDFDINQLLDISGLPGMSEENAVVVYEPTVLIEIESNPKNRSSDLESDYAQVRQNLNQQHQMMMAMAKITLETAKNAESPKYIETFTKLMDSMSNVNDKILKVHKEMNAITNEATKTSGDNNKVAPSMNIENATVFVGTPAELMAREGSQSDAISSAKGDIIEGESECL